MKTPARPALLLLALTAACGRDDAAQTAKPATDRPGLQTVAAKPALVPAGQRRVLELEGGVRVEVLAEGEGPVVGPGDEVALSMTLSYVPQPPPAKTDETKDEDAKPDEKSGAKPKSGDESDVKSDAKSDEKGDEKGDAKPDETAADAPGPSAPAPLEVAATGAVGESAPAETKPVDAPSPAAEVVSAPAASDAKSEDAKPQDAKPDEPKPTDAPPAEAPAADADAAKPAASDTPPADTPPAAPLPSVDPAPLPAALEPVVLVSTKNLGTPIRARIGASGGLLPGLSRALVGLRAGTIAEITLPPEAGYGAEGLVSAGIPAGTTLFATIEIREVKR